MAKELKKESLIKNKKFTKQSFQNLWNNLFFFLGVNLWNNLRKTKLNKNL